MPDTFNEVWSSKESFFGLQGWLDQLLLPVGLHSRVLSGN